MSTNTSGLWRRFMYSCLWLNKWVLNREFLIFYKWTKKKMIQRSSTSFLACKMSLWHLLCHPKKKKKRWYRNEVGVSLVAITTTKHWNIARQKIFFLRVQVGYGIWRHHSSLFSSFLVLVNFCCIKTNDNHPRMNKESVTKERAGNILGGIISN